MDKWLDPDTWITVRSITPDDDPFLYRLYASTRADEMALLNWQESDKNAFLRMQFHAQTEYYRDQFTKAEFLVLEDAGNPIGRLYIDHRADEIRIIDIALLPEFRNRGIGSTFLEAILKKGQDLGLPVRIHVEANNPALRLYRRLGFQKISENGVYYLMEKTPDQDSGKLNG